MICYGNKQGYPLLRNLDVNVPVEHLLLVILVDTVTHFTNTTKTHIFEKEILKILNSHEIDDEMYLHAI